MAKKIITAESVARAKIVAKAVDDIGVRQGSKAHKKLIDTFNTVKPDGAPMTYTAPWCDAYVSALAIETFGKEAAKEYFPLSYNCNTTIAKAKKMGIWKESDAYAYVSPGDWILYDWDDSGRGDNKNSADHIGIVRYVTSDSIHVIEGNKGATEQVGERIIHVNGRYIRGFVTPKYDRVTIQGRIIREADEMAKKAIKDKMIYDGSATHNTYNKAKKTDKRVNCATLASYILQAVKVLPLNRRIWLSDKINGSGATTLRKRSTVIHPKNKRTKDVMHQLEPGDLVGYKFGKNVHTMIYHHKEGRRVYWFTGGGSDFKARKLIRRRPFYYFKRVDIIVKVKQPD